MRDKIATVQDLEELPPFHSAARQGDEAQLSSLLETHPDLIDYGDGKGFTALMHAAFAKNIECMQLLLKSGSKPQVVDGKGRTALHFCARQGWSDGAEVLLKFGAKCSACDNNGRNSLHFGACSYEESCLEILVKDIGSDIINAVDCEGMTPLHWASFHNIEENVKVLLQHGAKGTLLDHEHKTPLHWAAQNGCVSACRSLLRSPFCELLVNQRTSDTKTALHLASIGGYLEVIFELAQAKGFAADISDKEGRTALHWACAVGSYRCVAGLLRLGVKHDIADSYGVTPIVYAKRLNHYQCASLIQKYNPHRPQDVLIPIESLAEHSNSIERNACRKEIMSNIEQDVFFRAPSCGKEQSNLEKVVQLQKQSLTIIEDLQSLRDACDEALDIESQYSDCDSYQSGEEGMGNNLAVRQDIQVELLLSDDEMRYQPQMSLTPPNGFVDTTIRPQRKKSVPKIISHNTHKKTVKTPVSPYKLAPIKSNLKGSRIEPKRDKFEAAHDKLDSSVQKIDSSHVHKTSNQPTTRNFTLGLFDQKQNSTLEQQISASASKDVPISSESPNRRVGLRRKSLSFTDAISHYGIKTAEKNVISRTQSYANMSTNKSLLPMIDIRDGRNLTQQIHLHQSAFLSEILDEIEPISVEECRVAPKKKKGQRKERFSRFGL